MQLLVFEVGMMRLFDENCQLDDSGRFEAALREAWCVETAFGADRNDWSDSRPYVGQCTVTAMLVFDYFGGSIIRGKSSRYNVVHYWNLIDGRRIDLTAAQFLPDKSDIEFDTVKAVDKRSLMRIKSVRVRYELLKQRFEKKWSSSADARGVSKLERHNGPPDKKFQGARMQETQIAPFD